jgi:hypothetical protein
LNILYNIVSFCTFKRKLPFVSQAHLCHFVYVLIYIFVLINVKELANWPDVACVNKMGRVDVGANLTGRTTTKFYPEVNPKDRM